MWRNQIQTIHLFVLGKNLSYQGKNLIFNNIIGGQIVECMYDVWCSPDLGKKIKFSNCKIIFFSLRRHSCICIGIIFLFCWGKKFDFLEWKYTNSSSSGKKFDFTEGKYTNSACLGKIIWFSWRRSYLFPLIKWLHTKDPSVEKKFWFITKKHILFP